MNDSVRRRLEHDSIEGWTVRMKTCQTLAVTLGFSLPAIKIRFTELDYTQKVFAYCIMPNDAAVHFFLEAADEKSTRSRDSI